jgi:hypothetical protein
LGEQVKREMMNQPRRARRKKMLKGEDFLERAGSVFSSCFWACKMRRSEGRGVSESRMDRKRDPSGYSRRKLVGGLPSSPALWTDERSRQGSYPSPVSGRPLQQAVTVRGREDGSTFGQSDDVWTRRELTAGAGCFARGAASGLAEAAAGLPLNGAADLEGWEDLCLAMSRVDGGTRSTRDAEAFRLSNRAQANSSP